MGHTALGMVVFQGSTFLAAIIVARELGPDGQGRFQLLVATAALLTTVLNLGLDESLAYSIPRYKVDRPGAARPAVLYSMAVTFLLAVAVGIAVFLAAKPLAEAIFRTDAVASDLRMALFLIPSVMVLNMGSGVLRGLDRSDLRAVVYYYFVGASFLAAIAVLALSGLSLLEVEVVRTVTYALGGVLAIYFIAKALAPLNRGTMTSDEVRKLHSLGGSLILIRLTQYVLEQPTVDLLIVGSLAPAAAAGIYFSAAKVGSVIAVGLSAMTIVSGPILAAHVARGDEEGLRIHYRWAARSMALIGSFVGLGVIVFRRDVLLLFGESYTDGQNILVAFGVAHIVGSVLGPNTPLLIALGRAKAEMSFTAIFSILMVAGGFVFGNIFGPIGVAVSSAASLAALAIGRYAFCISRLRIPRVTESIPAVVPAAAASVCAVALKSVLSGGALEFVVSATIFCVVFLGLGRVAIRELVSHEQ